MAPRSGPLENWAEVRELQENFALLSRWWVALRAPPPPPVAKQAQGQAAIAIMAKYFLYISFRHSDIFFSLSNKSHVNKNTTLLPPVAKQAQGQASSTAHTVLIF